MNCCSVEGTDRFFSRTAAAYEKKFKISGVDRVQQLILKGLKEAGVRDKTVLDIGCGVGNLHLTLLQQGATRAVGVEISEGMIERAERLANNLKLRDRVNYVRGDFVELAERIDQSDIVMLDKVVCCYAEPERLIAASTAKCKQLYVVSYPRDSFLGRVAMGVPALLGKVLRWSFHPYYHPPSLLLAAITRDGLTEVFSGATWIWQVRVFRWANQ
jgi:2-polyprenyl-3-methyl-5-hydroxy-6-metoxy-1,4-benzoquinol methylase